MAPWKHPKARRTHVKRLPHVCVSVCVSMCVIALTFHCHELVLTVVTAANCTVCGYMQKRTRISNTCSESFRHLLAHAFTSRNNNRYSPVSALIIRNAR